MARIGKLDERGYLVGVAEAASARGKPPDPGDLSRDGSYRWDESSGSYVPRGAGFGRVAGRPPVPMQLALARVIDALGKDAPPETRAWREWFGALTRQQQGRG